MPLDMGAVAQGTDRSSLEDGVGVASVDRGLGASLRAARIARGLSLDQVTLSTRIQPRHLAAIEEMRLDQLPSRPFSTGYIRAYAAAVGLDAETAAAQFRAEAPDGDEALRAPPGVASDRHRGLRLVGLAVVVVGAAVLVWNVAQHGIATGGVKRSALVTTPARARTLPAQGPLALGAPLPPPPEATTPKLYVTPGLEAASGDSGAPASSVDTAAQAAAQAPADPTDQPGAPFAAKGAVYGVAAAQSDITLQARTATPLIIHGADGTVYFARHLAAGEAYRAPRLETLVVSAPEPGDVRVFVGGVLKGPLAAPETPLAKLGG